MPPAPSYVLAAGRDAGRDYGTFLTAVGDTGWDVRIVASPRNLAGLRLPANVRVSYDVPPAVLRNLYRGAGCVVVPTHGDGYPYGSDCSGTLVMLDAMACARPAVITQRRSVEDHLSANREAITVPAGDAPSLRAAIERTLSSPDLTGQLGSAGRAAVETRFNTVAMAGELAHVFREVAETR